MTNKLIVFFAMMATALVSLQADEKSDVYRELSALKKDYRKKISEIRKAGNEELKAENLKSIKAIGAVGKGIEAHPDLAEQRKARDEAKAAYLKARGAGDAEEVKKTQKVLRDAEGKLSRDGFKLKEIQDLQAASVAQRKKVEELQYRLVAESGAEGKALMEKIEALEKRYEELKK